MTPYELDIIIKLIFMANTDEYLGPSPTLNDGFLYSSLSNNVNI